MTMSRRDESLLKRFRRRIGSSRAAVFLEFAFIAPILVLVISAMLEFTQLWDAKIMANHTAWTLGRIATVRGTDDADWKITEKIPAKVPIVSAFNSMKSVPTVLLMSTCGMGSFGTFSGDASDALKELIIGPIKKLKESIIQSITGKLTDLFNKIPIPGVGEGILKKLLELVNSLLTKVVDAVTKPLAKFIEKAMNELLKPLDDFTVGSSNRQWRQIVGASRRWVKFKDIVTFDQPSGVPWEFTKNNAKFGEMHDTSLSFPRCMDKFSKFDNKTGFLAKDSSWPANYGSQRMILTKVSWPFERGWMFPVVSGLQKNSVKNGDAIRAVGHSLVYSQPEITLKHLLSKGAKAYDEGSNTNKLSDIITKLEREIGGFMQLVAFGMDYRRVAETICGFDSKKGDSFTYKGIGRGGLYNRDGLVFWMGRAPGDVENQKAWKRSPFKDVWDYNASWRTLTHEKETARFWKIFGKKKTDLQKHLESPGYYRARNWFFWGLPGLNANAHERYRTNLEWATIATELGMSHLVFPPDHPPARNGQYQYGLCLLPEKDNGWSPFLSTFQYELAVRQVCLMTPSLAGVQKLTYNEYRRFSKMPGLRFKLEDWLSVYKSGSFDALVKREQAMASTLGKLEYQINHLRDFLRKEAEELRARAAGEVPDGEDGKLDWGVDQDQIMKDPNKAEKIIRAKFEKMKHDGFVLLREIDTLIPKIDGAAMQARIVVNSVCQQRFAMLRHFQGMIGCVAHVFPPIAGGTADDMVARLREYGSPYAGSYEQGLAQLEKVVKDLQQAIENSRQKEIAYGKLFCVGEAKKEGDKKIDDIDPHGDKEEPVDPFEPPPSSPASGTDNDWAGDKWSYSDSDKQWKAE